MWHSLHELRGSFCFAMSGVDLQLPLVENEVQVDKVDGGEESLDTDREDALVDFRANTAHENLMQNAWEGMTVEWDLWLLLLLVGLLTSGICFAVDAAIEELFELRYWMMDLTDSSLYRLGIWVLVGIFLLTFAWSFTQLISTDAIGSGIPRMKAILSGDDVCNTLSFQTLVAKVMSRGQVVRLF